MLFFTPRPLVGDGTTQHMKETVFWLTQQPLVTLRLSEARHIDFLVRTTTIGAIVGAIALRYMHLQLMWKRDLARQAQARVEALQARIRPHFLFNSMNTIASFTRTQPELAEQVVEDLSDLFRASLSDSSSSNLGGELALARGYLRIEALRLGERLQVEWEVDELPPTVEIPPLTLQPLVENAVIHGILNECRGWNSQYPRTRGGGRRLTIRVGPQTSPGWALAMTGKSLFCKAVTSPITFGRRLLLVTPSIPPPLTFCLMTVRSFT